MRGTHCTVCLCSKYAQTFADVSSQVGLLTFTVPVVSQKKNRKRAGRISTTKRNTETGNLLNRLSEKSARSSLRYVIY